MDEVVTFMDGMRLPCLFVENKRDLVKKKKKEDAEKMIEFAKNNGFIGCFRTSAKTGKKVSESMEFLIKNIIKRMDQIYEGQGKSQRTERKSIQLDPKNHTKTENARRRKKRCC